MWVKPGGRLYSGEILADEKLCLAGELKQIC